MKMMTADMKTYIYAVCFLLAAAGFSNAQQQEYNYFEQSPPAGAQQQSGTPPASSSAPQQYYYQQPSDAKAGQQTQTEYRFQQRGQYRFQEGTSFPAHLIEINANSDTFEGRFAGAFSFLPQGFSMGINGIGSDKDYYSFSLDGTYGTGFSGNIFDFDIGLRGVWGSAELNDQVESSLSAVGFLMKASYDIREFPLFGLFIDLDIGGEFSGAPSPLCFSDSQSYLDTRCYLDINLMPNKKSAITLGYRYLRMEFEDKEEWSKKDDAAYFGFKFRF